MDAGGHIAAPIIPRATAGQGPEGDYQGGIVAKVSWAGGVSFDWAMAGLDCPPHKRRFWAAPLTRAGSGNSLASRTAEQSRVDGRNASWIPPNLNVLFVHV